MNADPSINLARMGDTEFILIARGDNLASVSIIASLWLHAVVELQWSSQGYDPAQLIDQEWLGFSPPILFGANVPQRRSIDVSGALALRIEVVNASGGADSSAPIRAFTYRSS